MKMSRRTIMHSRGVKEGRNYLYESLRHVNHVCGSNMLNKRLPGTSLSAKMPQTCCEDSRGEQLSLLLEPEPLTKLALN